MARRAVVVRFIAKHLRVYSALIAIIILQFLHLLVELSYRRKLRNRRGLIPGRNS